MKTKKRRKRCDHCGELKDNLIKSIDPYIDELYPEDENQETLWCDSCYQDACDDI